MEFRLVCKMCNKPVKDPIEHMVEHDIMDKEHILKHEPLEFFNLMPIVEWSDFVMAKVKK